VTSTDADRAVRLAHDWFERHSGWAPPDTDTMDEWAADGVCQCPDGCWVRPDRWCEHGLASWRLILSALDPPDRMGRHDRAVARGEAGYIDPVTGLFVMTAAWLAGRGSCCGQGCRHCPYPAEPPPG
jgi:hypothetical protein